jgi:hypothetical protein
VVVTYATFPPSCPSPTRGKDRPRLDSVDMERMRGLVERAGFQVLSEGGHTPREFLKIEAVESGRVARENRLCLLGGRALSNPLDDPCTMGVGSFVVGVIAAPQEARRAGQVQVVQRDGIVGDGDGALTAEVVTGALG